MATKERRRIVFEQATQLVEKIRRDLHVTRVLVEDTREAMFVNMV